MLKKFSKRDQGFTLIEIILVLAIAGLILLLVFVALSGAQKTRRDTARKNDAARLLSSIESCAANNNGSYTTPVNCLAGTTLITGSTGYFSGNDPLGTAYASGSIAVSGTPTSAIPFTVNNTPCVSGSVIGAAVRTYQEAGAAYCVDNH